MYCTLRQLNKAKHAKHRWTGMAFSELSRDVHNRTSSSHSTNNVPALNLTCLDTHSKIVLNLRAFDSFELIQAAKTY